VTIAGQTVTVTQAAAPAPIVCGYNVTPSQINVGSGGSSATLSVSTDGVCAWSAASQVSWISIVGSGSGTGSAAVSIAVAANPTTSARSGVVTVGGRQVTVTQAGQVVQPMLTLSQTELILSAVAGSGTTSNGTVTVSSGTSSLPYSVSGGLPGWLTVSGATGSTPGSITLVASAQNLAAGSYTTNVVVSAPGSANGQVSVQVSFTVNSPVSIRVTPMALSFRIHSGGAEAAQGVRIRTSVPGVALNFQKSNASWLTISAAVLNSSWTLTARANPAGMAPGIYDGMITVACASAACAPSYISVRLEVLQATQTSTQRVTRIGSGGVVSAASFEQGVSEGSWVSIFGENLSQRARLWDSSDFQGNLMPRSLDGLCVKVDGKPAAIHFVSEGQVNIQVPSGIRQGWVPLEVEGSFGTDTSYVFVSSQTPALFQFDSRGQIAALTQDGRPVMRRTADAPADSQAARVGEIVAIFGTGFGPTSPRIEPGVVFSGAAPLVAQGAVEVTIGGKRAKVHFAGLSGAGLNQLNVEVPALLPGDHTVEVVINGVPAQFGGKLAVQ
jgi:uncharacterized protein (TIGR03437 family)